MTEPTAEVAPDVNADPEKRYAAAAAGPKRKDWIQSLECRQVFQRSLAVEQVGSIAEIAHALAGKFRFTCQTHERYSVAEHCVRGSRLLPPAFAGAFLLHELSEVYLPDIAGPMKFAVSVRVPVEGEPWRAVPVTNRPGTFNVVRTLPKDNYDQAAHDVPQHQADRLVKVLNDQRETILWSELERRHTSVMLDALGLSSLEPLIYSPEVKRLDWEMLAAEKRDLCGIEPESWNLPFDPAAVSITRTMAPERAAVEFLERFHALFG